MSAKEKTHGTAVLTCVNHPTLRWVQTKYSLPGVTRAFQGRGALSFKGEEDGKPAAPLVNLTVSQLYDESPEYQEWFVENYTPECDCPEHDLIFLRWTS